jgi:hypothetical protein
MQKFSIKYLKTKSNNTLKTIIPGHQWLTSIILATQGAEIRRIWVSNQPGEIVHKTLS